MATVSPFRLILLLCMALFVVPSYSAVLQNPKYSTFDEVFTRVFGNQNVVFNDDKGYSVQISLDSTTGSGFKSKNPYLINSLLSASIKLPPGNYTAGVVVTFYTSNSDEYGENRHDELDFEFLGHANGGKWKLQTNMYGNGSVTRGREERYDLPFDPSADFHVYSVIWSEKVIVFYVDGSPIREIKRVDAMGEDFPSKPMNLYATIWDGSDWASGNDKVNYKYAPFISKYSNFVLDGCYLDSYQSAQVKHCEKATNFVPNFSGLTAEERAKMTEFRKGYMYYSYCDDRKRYPNPLPECLA